MKRYILSALFIAAAWPSVAQLKLPALSPNAKISQDFSVSSIDIAYSRPSMRNRKIFGDLVQYGSVWRTGANAATKIKFGEDVEIKGAKVKAGEYALYTIPGKESWEIILNTGTGNWGADGYSKENDILRFKVKPSFLEQTCQTFTINIADISFSTCKIEMMWERTKITIPVKALSDESIDKSIDKAINHPSVPYFQVASYYYENDRNLDMAAEYVDKALETQPDAYWVWYLKARIEKRLGHNEKAIEAARKSIEAAKGSANEADNARNNQKIIDAAKNANKLPTDRKSY